MHLGLVLVGFQSTSMDGENGKLIEARRQA